MRMTLAGVLRAYFLKLAELTRTSPNLYELQYGIGFTCFNEWIWLFSRVIDGWKMAGE